MNRSLGEVLLSMIKKHKKMISNRELEAIYYIKNRSLMENTLICSVNGNLLEEFEGKHLDRVKWDIVKMYNEAIKPFHNIQVDRFSPGIYSFMGSNKAFNEMDYIKYLLFELNEIVELTSSKGDNKVLKGVLYNIATITLENLKRNNIEIKDFCLCHGDLYNGNILLYDNKYALIDFEYLRFGPFQMEMAFFLFWDVITTNDKNMYEKGILTLHNNITELMNNNIINKFDYNLIINLYLPLLLCCSLQYCECEKYVFNEKIQAGIHYFCKNDFDMFREIGNC